MTDHESSDRDLVLETECPLRKAVHAGVDQFGKQKPSGRETNSMSDLAAL